MCVAGELYSWGVLVEGRGALEAPSGGLGAQSQKALKFCILMTFRGF